MRLCECVFSMNMLHWRDLLYLLYWMTHLFVHKFKFGYKLFISNERKVFDLNLIKNYINEIWKKRGNENVVHENLTLWFWQKHLVSIKLILKLSIRFTKKSLLNSIATNSTTTNSMNMGLWNCKSKSHITLMLNLTNKHMCWVFLTDHRRCACMLCLFNTFVAKLFF